MSTTFELLGRGESFRGIGAMVGISRNTVRKYLRSPGVPTAEKRRQRASSAPVNRCLSQLIQNRLKQQPDARGWVNSDLAKGVEINPALTGHTAPTPAHWRAHYKS